MRSTQRLIAAALCVAALSPVARAGTVINVTNDRCVKLLGSPTHSLSFEACTEADWFGETDVRTSETACVTLRDGEESYAGCAGLAPGSIVADAATIATFDFVVPVTRASDGATATIRVHGSLIAKDEPGEEHVVEGWTAWWGPWLGASVTANGFVSRVAETAGVRFETDIDGVEEGVVPDGSPGAIGTFTTNSLYGTSL